jgi:hypothetical protein
MFGNPDAVSWKSGRVDVFVLGNNGSANHVFHRYWDNGTFSAWQDWGMPAGTPYINLGPTAASWGPGRIDLYIIGGEGTPHLWHGYCTNTTQCNTAPQNWNDWGTGPPGKVLFGYPSATSWGDQRLDVFVMQTDGNVGHRWYDHGSFGWDTWAKPTQGSLASDVAAVGGGDGRLFVDAKGPSGAIWELKYDFALAPSWLSKGNGASVGTTPDLTAW